MTTLLFPLILIVFPLSLAFSVLYLWRWRRQHSRRRSPLTREIFRLPGHGLLHQIDDLTWDIPALLACLLAVPGIVLAGWGYQAWEQAAPSYWSGTGVVAVMTLSIMVVLLALLWKRIDKRQRLIDAFRAELATAQALDPLKSLGCQVFHDVQAKGFNIDHVVVGPGGVFAVETKSRQKPNRGRGKDDARVTFDGERLTFPDWRDTRSLEQAKRQASWLENHLSRSTGSKVTVKPVLALPGWFVESKGRGDVSVINPINCNWMAKPSVNDALDASAIERIRYQLERLCVIESQETGMGGQGRYVQGEGSPSV